MKIPEFVGVSPAFSWLEHPKLSQSLSPGTVARPFLPFAPAGRSPEEFILGFRHKSQRQRRCDLFIIKIAHQHIIYQHSDDISM
jgi:hypothetical protein